jgi:CheY-like chemotaxis protein
MDIQMPEMDGYTATATLRQHGYAGHIIALTAHASQDDRARCLDSGFDGFAVKPIQKDQLFATCREYLEKSAKPGQNCGV